MKNLFLVRHAKSSWQAPLNDFDRPLTQSGIKDSHLVSSMAKDFLPKAYIIWSSKAKRACETALIFAQNFSYPIENILFRDDLYTFDEKDLQKVIQSCPDEIDNLILFGHNEAITNFVNTFGTVYIDNVPTSGFISISFDSNSWKFLKKGVTNKTIFPRDLR